MIKEITLTKRMAGLIIEALDSLAVELSGREDRAEDFGLVEWFADELEKDFNFL